MEGECKHPASIEATRERINKSQGEKPMDGKAQSEEIQWKARCMARVCARWLRRNGKLVDGTQCRELEADLVSLLSKYRDEWGVNIVGLRLDPAGATFQRSLDDFRPDS
jgi:hypothetical protein